MAYRYRAHDRSGKGGVRATDHPAGAPNTRPADAPGTHPADAAGPPRTEESTAADRIRTAAIHLWGRHGFDGATLKEIAAAAHVSTSLVIHHFESKAGLRRACDRHAAEIIRQSKQETVARVFLPNSHIAELMRTHKPVLLYTLHSIAAGGDEADALFDRLVEDSLEYTAEGEKMGLISPSADPRRRAALLMVQGFGSLLMHHQIKRHLGVDPVDGAPEELGPYVAGVMELYTKPLLNPRVYQNLLDAAATLSTPTEPSNTSPPGTTSPPGMSPSGSNPPTPPGTANPTSTTTRTEPRPRPSRTPTDSHKEHQEKGTEP